MASGTSGEEYLEEMIGRGESIESVLKFMVLLSLTSGGVASKKYELMKKDILQSYGMQHLLTLDLLEQYQLLSRYETLRRLYSSASEYMNWAAVKGKFALVAGKEQLQVKESEENFVEPSSLGQFDMNLVGSYANGGYAPLSARLVEASTRNNGWKAIQSELKELRGKCYLDLDLDKDKLKQQQKSDRHKQPKLKAQQKSDAMSAHKTVLVFFVGGVTYAEISAIRMLEARPNTPWKFIVASTSIVRGNDIINAFIDQDLK